MLGIASINVCVMLIERMNTPSSIGEKNDDKKDDDARTSVEMRLIWMPGIRPVNTPAQSPSSITISIGYGQKSFS